MVQFLKRNIQIDKSSPELPTTSRNQNSFSLHMQGVIQAWGLQTTSGTLMLSCRASEAFLHVPERNISDSNLHNGESHVVL
jgi:hypothetical protein